MRLMEECFRWYGPNDPVPLSHIRQAGATGIVSALHHIYDGSAWPLDQILAQKAQIEAAGMRWSVVESIPVHNSIKLATADSGRHIGWYKDTLRALAQAGIDTVCYNFMPVVDWTRTDLMQPLANGGYALRFDAVDFAAYDLFVLKRPRVEDSYTGEQIAAARQRFAGMDEATIGRIERNLIAGLPATERSFDRASFLAALAEYDGVTAEALHENTPASCGKLCRSPRTWVSGSASIRTIRPFRSMACRASSQRRRMCGASLPPSTARRAASPSAPAPTVRAPKTTCPPWSANSGRASTSPICATSSARRTAPSTRRTISVGRATCRRSSSP